MGLFDFFKKKPVQQPEPAEDDLIKYNLRPDHTYFIPQGLSANGIMGKVRLGDLKVGDYCKMADDSTDFIIEIAEMYDTDGNAIEEAHDGDKVSVYAKVNGRSFKGHGVFEKIE
ncbi:MAG: hypothetical protein IKN24_08050 [Lachnospiraceae bacterium]|nr:hypothetical protein [Lachnospiraceae bacterium]